MGLLEIFIYVDTARNITSVLNLNDCLQLIGYTLQLFDYLTFSPSWVLVRSLFPSSFGLLPFEIAPLWSPILVEIGRVDIVDRVFQEVNVTIK